MGGKVLNRKSKSHFYLYLKKFMLTVVVSCMTILLLYMQTEKLVKNQTIISNQSILNQFFKQVDVILQEMQETVVSVVSDTTCKNYALYTVQQPEKAHYQSYVVMKMLEKLPKEKYHDVFAYFPESGQIISGFNGAINAEYYYDAHYRPSDGKEQQVHQEFLEILSCDSKRASLYTLNGKSGEIFLCMAMKCFHHKDARLNYTVVLILEPTYVERMMFGINSQKKGTVLMFGNDGKLLLTSDSKDIDFSLKEDGSNAELYETTVSGKKYMVQIQKSEIVDVQYAFVTPNDYFWEQLSQLRVTCGLGGIIIILFSLYLAYKNAKVVYLPIEKSIHMLQEKTKSIYDASVESEIEFIEEILERQYKEKKHYLNNNEIMKIEKIMLSLLHGNIEETILENELLENQNFELYSNRFQVCILELGKGNRLESTLFLFVLKNIISELCGKESANFVLSISATRYVIILNPNQILEESELLRILEIVKQFLEKNYVEQVTMGISSIRGSMKEIFIAYEEAEQALRYKYLLGVNNIISYSKVCEREFQYSIDVESKLSRMIMAYVDEKHMNDPTEIFVERILILYGIDEMASIDTVECFKFEIISALNKVLISGECFNKENKERLKKLLNAVTLDEFRKYFCELLNILKEQVSKGDVCKRAYKYILDNYMNSELSVALLGEKLKISPSYLSKLFKEKYKINLLDHIAHTRVQNAKNELKNTKKTVQQIAEDNGFLSSNVFIKIFKKWEGITPGAYRRLLEEKYKE